MTTTLPSSLLSEFAFAFDTPDATGLLKNQPEDFVVEEQLAFELSGEGEHLWCWVEKVGQNTDWVQKQLAKWANILARNVGVAGQKDRHAVTRQWFSLHLPGVADPDIDCFDVEGVRIVKQVRHHRKLQKGGLSGNRFEITLQDVKGEPSELEARLLKIQTQGVPNYFGEQRFGRGGNNLKLAEKLFAGEAGRMKRTQKSMVVSSARSWLFNLILSHRIENDSWNRFLPGDVLQLEGSSRWFEDDGSDKLEQRVVEQDLHPTGALVGRGALPSQKTPLSIENEVCERYADWVSGLEKLGLKQDRRALRVIPKEFVWQWRDAKTLTVCFDLPAGSYATMVVREILAFEDVSRR